MAEAEGTAEPWWKDRWLLAALGVGLAVRVIPLALWPMLECVRDECIYRSAAYGIVEGKGLTTSTKGWLPAPGIPFMLAASKVLTGSFQAVKGLHVLLGMVSTLSMYRIGNLAFDKRVARAAAWLFALNPTVAWFTNTLWIETFYIFFLLGAIDLLLVSRKTTWGWALLSGALLGCAVLFRGVATYLPPFFLLALLLTEAWPASLSDFTRHLRGRLGHLVGFVAGLVLLVAPYSVYGSKRYGGFMLSDATAGHVLYLGDNDFPPLTFDYGNGMLTTPIFKRYLRIGREPCDREELPVQSMACESRLARDWILSHPQEFVGRIPMRLAQLVNPHSFLTRHIRWGYFPGMPWWMKEALVLYNAAFASAVMVGGAVGAWAKARGPFAIMAIGTVVYTVATIALVYGMTRFRLPLEPLLSFYLAVLLVNGPSVWAELRQSVARQIGLMLTVPPLIALMLWYLPTGWPLFW